MRPGRSLLVSVPLLMVLAACSSNAGAGPTQVAGPTASPLPAVAASAGPSAASPAGSSAGRYGSGAGKTQPASTIELKVATKAGLGSFLTDGKGMTLYVFKKDVAGSSACSGQCVASWPPLELATGGTVTEDSGVTGTTATIMRTDDGQAQVTYGGQPLYYFAKDAAAGDANGQGILGVWFVAPVTGSAAAPASSAPSASSGGYTY